MTPEEISDWESFERRVKELRAEYNSELSPLLFRGQANAAWRLTTTLERNWPKRMLFREYYQLICASIGPEVKTFANLDVPAFDLKLCDRFLESTLLYEFGEIFPVPVYRHMAYLRHLAFPSPLLDWSRSPFVAAFFAFRDTPSGGEVPKRAVFAYCEKPRGGKGANIQRPVIRQLGPYVQTHERHFRQRCEYTICGGFNADYGWSFDSHQSVFDRNEPGQDMLWKFVLPSSERERVLATLADYNLNAFSLFGSEESLLETLWFREQVLRNLK